MVCDLFNMCSRRVPRAHAVPCVEASKSLNSMKSGHSPQKDPSGFVITFSILRVHPGTSFKRWSKVLCEYNLTSSIGEQKLSGSFYCKCLGKIMLINYPFFSGVVECLIRSKHCRYCTISAYNVFSFLDVCKNKH